MKQKIYEIHINGEKEWICADTSLEALKFYCGLTDILLTEFEDDDDIIEVPKEKWSKMNIVDTEVEPLSDGSYPIVMSFDEYMRIEATKVDIIATTNY